MRNIRRLTLYPTELRAHGVRKLAEALPKVDFTVFHTVNARDDEEVVSPGLLFFLIHEVNRDT